ncbi:Smr/MutS family protein [bacterium]|nr:Smr/MutS family protein [bacterium]
MYNNEWFDILRWIASFAPSKGAQSAVESLPPLSQSEAEKKFSQLEEYKTLHKTEAVQVSFSLDSVNETMRAFDANESLEIGAYRHIGEFLRTVRQTLSALRYAEYPTAILSEIGPISPPIKLENEIFNTVTPKGEIAEDASKELQKIRARMRDTHTRAGSAITSMIKDPEYGGLLQEEYFTVRHDRYVLPFKSAFKRVVKGVVHNYSRTGKTAFLEPLSLMDTNNRLALLVADENEEITRIVNELRGSIFRARGEIKRAIFAATLLETLYTVFKWSESYHCAVPHFSDSRTNIVQAWYPPVMLSNKSELVKNDFLFADNQRIMVVSGPNAGGKTVSLKTVHTVAELSRRGLPVPAERVEIPFFENVHLVLGDLQSAHAGESSFSSHLRELSRIAESASSRELVLIDEIGSGTDPLQGGAMARAFLEFLQERGVWTVVTSHLAEVKSVALEHDSFVPVAMGYDEEQNVPTYHFLYNLVGGSNALNLVRKIGFPQGIISRLESLLSSGEHSIEPLINRLRKKETELLERERELEQLRMQAEKAMQDAEELKKRHAKREKAFEAERFRALKKLLELEEQELQKRLATIDEKRLANQVHKVREEKKVLQKKIENQTISTDEKSGTPLSDLKDSIKKGEAVVYDKLLKIEGIIESFSGKNATIRANGKVLTMPISRLIVVGKKPEAKSHFIAPTSQGGVTSFTLDLRGMSAEEAIHRLEIEIDRAFSGDVYSIEIIHGHGTGVLKEKIRARLGELVSHYGYRFAGGGKDGSTMVEFR